eukprot:5707926-Heterocapsa_arctica.AAC.1
MATLKQKCVYDVDDETIIADIESIDAQLYTALTLLLVGDAMDIVRNVSSKSGMETWRKLVRRYDLEDGLEEKAPDEHDHQSWDVQARAAVGCHREVGGECSLV